MMPAFLAPRRLLTGLACVLLMAADVDGQLITTTKSSDNRPRASSARLSFLLASTLPPYVQPTEKSPTLSASSSEPRPRNAIVRLPDFVQHLRVPDNEEVLSQKGVESVAMNRYLGSVDGLDRGFLNRFTLAGLGFRIPGVGMVGLNLFNAVTNQQRAVRSYMADKRAKELAELMSLLAIDGQKAPEGGPKP